MSILNVATPLGQVASFALTGYTFANASSEEGSSDSATIIERTKSLIVYQNVPYIFLFIILQIVIRDRPEHPPSAVAAAPPSGESFCESFRVMWANKNFMLQALAFALIYGVYCAVGATMSNLVNPFGYTPTDISIAGGMSLLCGLVSALAIGCFLDHTALYKRTHVSLSLMTMLSVLVAVIALATLPSGNQDQ